MVFGAFERMVAMRYLRARRQEGFISVIAGFSLLGIALGVATLIIVMSVMNGFRHELLSRILGLNGHMAVYAELGPVLDYQAVAQRLAAVKGVVQTTPTVEGQVMATANGAATAGSDYQFASGPLTFAPGETTQTITVLVKGDRLAEPNENFVVKLSDPTHAIIVDGQAVGAIVDDEPLISISDVSKYEGRKGRTTLFTFTVTLSVEYDQPVTMSFQTVNGTATTSDNDYVTRIGTLTFAPGETTKTITIEVKGYSKREAAEMVYVDLFDLSTNSLFTKNRGIGTILTDD